MQALKIPILKCPNCATRFARRHAKQIFCSRTCSNTNNARSKKPRKKELPPTQVIYTDQTEQEKTDMKIAIENYVGFFYTILSRLSSLEARIEAVAVSPAPAPTNDSMEAEIAYLKEAIRKARTEVEDQEIKTNAVQARLSRLETELGVA